MSDALAALEQDIKRGQAIKRLLDEPEIAAALAECRRRIIERWEQAKTPTDREALHAELRGLMGFHTRLTELVNTGEHAASEANRAKARSPR